MPEELTGPSSGGEAEDLQADADGMVFAGINILDKRAVAVTPDEG